VNNVAGSAGGGISLQDVALARIVNNTIANNDSTGTSIAAFNAGANPANPNQSAPQPAGVVAWAHSGPLEAATGVPHADPVLANNIIWHNRSFYWRADATVQPPVQGLVPDIGLGQPAVYDDLGILGEATGQLHPEYCILSPDPEYIVTGGTNFAADPGFLAEYVNGDRLLSITQPGVPSSITTYAAFDEGGNFLSVEYGPLTNQRSGGGVYGDYHLGGGSQARGEAQAPAPAVDFDDESRPIGGGFPDIGADERG
jgi:hypothetical protein